MIRALVIAALLASPAAAAPALYDHCGERVALQTTVEAAIPLRAPPREEFETDSVRTGWELVIDRAVPGTPWRLGGAARMTSEPVLALGLSLARDLPSHRIARLELGTFACSLCRGLNDPRGYLRAEVDFGPVFLAAELRVTAFDALSSARPLGTRAEVFAGAGVRDWRGALGIIAFETGVWLLAQTRPNIDD